MEIKEVKVVILEGLGATGLDFLRGDFDLGSDQSLLLLGELEEIADALKGAFLPSGGVFTSSSDEGEWSCLLLSLFLSQEEADAISTEEDYEKRHQDGEVVAEARFHGADGEVGGAG